VGTATLLVDFTGAQILISDQGRCKTLYSRVMSLGLVVMVLKFLISFAISIFFLLKKDFTLAILAGSSGVFVTLDTAATVMRSSLEGAGQFKPNVINQTLCFL
jgi:hypothetical protein